MYTVPTAFFWSKNPFPFGFQYVYVSFSFRFVLGILRFLKTRF